MEEDRAHIVSFQRSQFHGVRNGKGFDVGLSDHDREKQISMRIFGCEIVYTVTQCYREFDDGIEKYDIKFYANGMEYDYDVEVSSGRIIGRDIESAYDD